MRRALQGRGATAATWEVRSVGLEQGVETVRKEIKALRIGTMRFGDISGLHLCFAT